MNNELMSVGDDEGDLTWLSIGGTDRFKLN